jgi:hypothetical protein
VRIEVKRDPDLGVAEAFARYLGMGASCEEVCSVAVPKIPLSARNLVKACVRLCGCSAARLRHDVVVVGQRNSEQEQFLKFLPKKYFRFRVTRRAAASSLGSVEFSKGAAFWPGRLDSAWRSTD